MMDLFQESLEERNKKGNTWYEIVRTERDLNKLKDGLNAASAYSLDLETTGLDPFSDRIVGISLSTEKGVAFYIPINHKTGELQQDERQVIEFLRKLLKIPNKYVVLHNAKFDFQFLRSYGITEIKSSPFDTMIAALLLNNKSSGLKALSKTILGKDQTTYEHVTKGANITFDRVEIEEAAYYACQDADYTLSLYRIFKAHLEERGQMELLRLEMKVLMILLLMERMGVKIDLDYLERVGPEYRMKIEKLEQRLKSLLGDINLSSQKQLGQALFEKMNFPVLKKTKTSYGVDSWVMEELKRKTGNELFDLILEHRKLEKAYGTYVIGIKKGIDENNRVHTNFWQMVNTGRLSSSGPNLQNIPPAMRRAIIPEKGKVLLSLDYSQIELRVLALESGDRILTESFEKGEDVHARTAREIYGCEEVTDKMRKHAKTMNFALVYGSTEYGIASGLGIPVDDAREFIKKYFRKYSGVLTYMEKTKEFARTWGFVKTFMGRRILIPGIKSDDPRQRGRAERVAINSPIQGGAADIIKIAMTRVADVLPALDVELILQVHDELVFEASEEKPLSVAKELKRIMEIPTEEDFKVPLVVDVEMGKNYGEMKGI